MPPRGGMKSSKRARQYEHVEESYEDGGVSEARAKEIAARTVDKERARGGEAHVASELSLRDLPSRRRGGIRSHRKAPRGRTHDQPYDKAHRRNLTGRSKMTKAELEHALGGRS